MSKDRQTSDQATYARITKGLSAFVITRNGNQIAQVVAITGVSGGVSAFVNGFDVPVSKGISSKNDDDKLSAAIVNAVQAMENTLGDVAIQVEFQKALAGGVLLPWDKALYESGFAVWRAV
jgi:hypothetical protein